MRSLVIACLGGFAVSQTDQDCPAAGSRKDCGWYGVTNDQCKQAGCCYEETPGEPYCFHRTDQPGCPAVGSRKDCGWFGVTVNECKDKGCCYEEVPGEPFCFHSGDAPVQPAQHGADQSLINEFNDETQGIAFSMISLDAWRHPGDGHGNNGMDACGFFPFPPTTYMSNKQQAVSIVTRAQDMNPYGAYGAFGLAFHITRGGEFWKYFQVRGDGVLCAQPGDGWKCAPNGGSRRMIQSMGKDYDWFKAQKNAILARYNTWYHIHDYNEFDTNGLSPSDLAGVFVNDHWFRAGPTQQEMCDFLTKANPERTTPWPVYGYQWRSMYIKYYLPCGGVASNTTQTKSVLV